MQPDGGAGIHEVGDLHHVLLLAPGIRGHAGGVFEIELDFLSWLAQFRQLGFTTASVFDTARLAQNFPDGCLRAWQAQTSIFECWIAVQVVEDGFGSMHAAQVLWWSDADLQNA